MCQIISYYSMGSIFLLKLVLAPLAAAYLNFVHAITARYMQACNLAILLLAILMVYILH
jgi:hypothetical protein